MDKKQILLANMHTFSIVAKHLSFTKAAKELNLTQGAVSYRIKILEQHLKFPVFIRLTRKLELTPEGLQILQTLNTSFEKIFNELDEISSNELSGDICIGTSPGFANSWLIPRLASFQAAHPKFNLRVITKEYRYDFEQEAIDLAIYYSKGHYPGMYSEYLFDESFLPVCTPAYAQRFELEKKGLKGLEQVTFIHINESDIWPAWLNKMQLNINCHARCYQFSQRGQELLAATHSLGVAMARQASSKALISQGKLIAPFPSISTGGGYDLVCPHGMQHKPKFKAFSAWVHSELTRQI